MNREIYSHPWHTETGERCYTDNGERYGGDGPNIVAPWIDAPDPGEGYRLATAVDNGATEFDVWHSGIWERAEAAHIEPLEVSSQGFRWGAKEYYAPFARVRVAPTFVPGSWYDCDREKLVFIGNNPVTNLLVFAWENGVMREFSSSMAKYLSPWSDPPQPEPTYTELREVLGKAMGILEKMEGKGGESNG